MGKKISTTMAIMIAIVFAAPSIFAASPAAPPAASPATSPYYYRSVTPDKTACFYNSTTGEYISIATRKTGTIAAPGMKVKVAVANGAAYLDGNWVYVTGTMSAWKGKYTASDGTTVRWRENDGELSGGTSNVRTMYVGWEKDSDGSEYTWFGVYDPVATTWYYPSLTKIKCKDLAKIY